MKSNKLITLKQAHQQKESAKVNVEFDEAETYKVVSISVCGLLKPYLF